MGRKDKLRREKQRNKTKNLTATAPTAPTHDLPTGVVDEEGVPVLYIEDREFPKSVLFLPQEASGHTLLRGAIEEGCVHSMFHIGLYHTRPNLGEKFLHVALPWFLEGSIRGSIKCAKMLIMEVYDKAQPHIPDALQVYWRRLIAKYDEQHLFETSEKSMLRDVKEDLERKCIICGKKDTKRLTLRQCMGCSTYCYCGEACQATHWEKHKHRSECKQVKILNKYHKPFAKEIRKAAIRGETHPALEKLRNKLGLTRPTAEYQALGSPFRVRRTPTPNTTVDTYPHLIAREDGTVWIGSTPHAIGPASSDTTSITTTTSAMMGPDTITAPDIDSTLTTMHTSPGGTKTKLKVVYRKKDKNTKKWHELNLPK
mmetsp:Transcript_33204/g.38284  ORF Transcript_33204/g.38284 Transcript_33204/m.38284 type:complete len:370 (+) Transcript_33204:213-1322(+)